MSFSMTSIWSHQILLHLEARGVAIDIHLEFVIQDADFVPHSTMKRMNSTTEVDIEHRVED
jgi:hypothetical protein